jgi:amidophosphoribosyltransferase
MLKEECGIFGIYGLNEVSKYIYLGLNFLQHRGQESCGIVTSDGNTLFKQVGLGKVSEFFDERKIEYLEGFRGIGHVRYSTTGSPTLVNAQPISAVTSKGAVAIAHNGNITNAAPVRQELLSRGKIFHSTSDSELIVHLISEAPADNLVDAVRWTLGKLEGAFAVLVISRDIIIAARDPMGFRPLSMGKIGNTIGIGDTIVFSSENSAFNIVEATYIRDLEPNEMMVVSADGVKSMQILEQKPKTNQCVFELIYFAKPSSKVFGKSVYDYRFAIGERLAREYPVEADYIVPVPDSGIVAALGYSKASGIPFAMGLIRSHYIGRTFIEPSQKIRDFGVKLKFIPVPEVFEGKRIVLIDDSIVRGTTSRKIVKMVRNCNPKSIHFRIASPPVKHPCFYGIDFSNPEELLTNKMHTLEDIARYIDADTVGYVSVDGLFDEEKLDRSLFCKACFNSEYPTPITKSTKSGFENEIKEQHLR